VRLLIACRLQWFIYIHRRASFVDTSHCGIPREEMPISRFTFTSLADVWAFWTTLHKEIANTPAGLLLLMMMIMILIPAVTQQMWFCRKDTVKLV